MIGFLSDFGSDSAAAICRGVILSIVRDAQIVDIDHGVRKYAIGEGAFLLWAALPWLPVGVHLGVVDPGVGTARRAIGLRVGRGDLLIGPDNGLLRPAAERLGGIVEARLLENPDLALPSRSSTFHGRDVFAPMAAHLAAGVPFESVGPLVEPATLVELRFPEPALRDGELELTVVYVDSFGNVRFAAEVADLAALGIEVRAPTPWLELAIAGDAGARPATPELERAPLVAAFGEVDVGKLLLYQDSNGSLALGLNQGHAAGRLGLAVGDRIRLRAAPSGAQP